MVEFIPTTLGVALVEGYDNIGLETSLSKPFLRKDMELQMKDICEGRKTKQEVIETSLSQYRQAYMKTEDEFNKLKEVRLLHLSSRKEKADTDNRRVESIYQSSAGPECEAEVMIPT